MNDDYEIQNELFDSGNFVEMNKAFYEPKEDDE